MIGRWLILLTLAALAAGPSAAAEPFDGRWSRDVAACADESTLTSPLVVTSQWLTWPGVACMVATSYRVGELWHIGARCWGEGSTANVPIRLKRNGERLVLDWARARPEELKRCP